MPRRPPPGNVAAIEAVLASDPVVWAGLQRASAIGGWDHWTRSCLATGYQHIATALMAWQMTQSGACAPSDALEHAAIALGISPDTALARARRWLVSREITLSTLRTSRASRSLDENDSPARGEAA